jgi:hypothetical protein
LNDFFGVELVDFGEFAKQKWGQPGDASSSYRRWSRGKGAFLKKIEHPKQMDQSDDLKIKHIP